MNIQKNAMLHHITIQNSDPQKTYDFYHKALGFRLIKQTVKHDSPHILNLIFATSDINDTVIICQHEPGTSTGRRGTSQVTKLQLAIPRGHIGYWMTRLADFHIVHQVPKKQFGISTLTFFDYDGTQIELIQSDNEIVTDDADQDRIISISRVFGAEISVHHDLEISNILTKVLKYKVTNQTERITRYCSSYNHSSHIDVYRMSGWPGGVNGAGTISDAAISVSSPNLLDKYSEDLKGLGYKVSKVIDETYYKSIRFSLNDGLKFTISSKTPGFLIDEKVDKLGLSIQIPNSLKGFSQGILKGLPSIQR